MTTTTSFFLSVALAEDAMRPELPWRNCLSGTEMVWRPGGIHDLINRPANVDALVEDQGLNFPIMVCLCCLAVCFNCNDP